jgi:hypothetical protein
VKNGLVTIYTCYINWLVNCRWMAVMKVSRFCCFAVRLGNYLYLLYQLVGKLPLDGGYESFPFLLFRCENLTVIRQQPD